MHVHFRSARAVAVGIALCLWVVLSPRQSDGESHAEGTRRLVYEVAPLYTVADDPALHVVPSGTEDGIGDLIIRTPAGSASRCTATLLPTGKHVLTAAHCLTDDNGAFAPGTTATVTFSANPAQTASVASFTVHPGWNGDLLRGDDLAILELSEVVDESVERYDIDRQPADDIGSVGDKFGYGRSGTGLSGSTLSAGTKRTGQNRYDDVADTMLSALGLRSGTDFVPGSVLQYDFDNGQAVNDAFGLFFGQSDLGQGEALEVLSAPGDSGGPTLNSAGEIVGITSYGLRLEFTSGFSSDIDGQLNSTFGEFAGDTRVSSYSGFIDEVLATEMADPLYVTSSPRVFRVGDDGLVSLEFANVASPSGGNLAATFLSGSSGGDIVSVSGAITDLQPGKSDTRMVAQLETDVVGSTSGSVDVIFTSSPYGTQLGVENITVEADVFQPAKPLFGSAYGSAALLQLSETDYVLDLGTYFVGYEAPSSELQLTNTASATEIPYTDTLSGTFDVPDGSPFVVSGFDRTFDLAGAGALDGFLIDLDTSTFGEFSQFITFTPVSNNPELNPLSLPNVTIQLLADIVFRGDVNGDSLINADDIDGLFEAIRVGSADPVFDVDMDGGLADESDVTALLDEVFNTSVGDANLDGAVDIDDFTILSINFLGTGGWASGNFDVDPVIDLDDFTLLSINFDASSGPTDFVVATAPLATAVPGPPLTVLLSGLVIATLLLRSRESWSVADSTCSSWVSRVVSRG